MQYVVFGATGYIGSHIFGQLKKDGCHVIGTSRREYAIEDGIVFYDILRNETIDNVISKISDVDRVAIICIANPKINSCAENYDDAYMVNVTRAKELINTLSMRGFRIIFFSSENVFDGRYGNYDENSERNPVNSYGMMKKEMEDYLLSREMEVCILRLSKTVSILREKQNILSEWTDRIEKGSIRCVKGKQFSFVSIDDIYKVCRIIAEKKMRGLYNIAGDKAYRLSELACMLYNNLGVDKVAIQECDAKEFYLEKIPLDSSMSNAKFKVETGYIFESMNYVIERYINNLKPINR